MTSISDRFDEAEADVDHGAKKWSVLVGSVVLTKRLIEGLVEEWDNDLGEFVVVKTLGRVQPGEIVSMKYVGDVEGGKYPYPNFKVSRKPAAKPGPEDAPAADEPTAEQGRDDDIPF